MNQIFLVKILVEILKGEIKQDFFPEKKNIYLSKDFILIFFSHEVDLSFLFFFGCHQGVEFSYLYNYLQSFFMVPLPPPPLRKRNNVYNIQ